jgi:hypothetical protein
MPDLRGRPETLLDRRLIVAPLRAVAACAIPALPLGLAAAGAPGAAGVAWGLAAVALNNVAAAWVSAQGAATRSGIAVGRVLVALPIRLALLAAALWVAVVPVGLPAKPVALAVAAGEMCVLLLQSWLVLRGPTFVGPLAEGRSET